MTIAIVVLTHNRLPLLQKCVENVLRRTSEKTTEIVIWNNASTDGTAEYLDSLDDPRLRVVHHDTNIAQNAYAHAFARTTAPYMLEVDDDIIDAPQNWDATLLDAFERVPHIGYLAASLIDNPNDSVSRDVYEKYKDMYKVVEINGVRLKTEGPVGGGCTITSRDLNERVGGFPQNKKTAFFLEAAAYIRRIKQLGYEAAYLEDLKVLHAGGSFYSAITPEKQAFWDWYNRRVQRKNAVKRVLLRLPLVARVNDRYGLFRLWEPASNRHRDA